MLIRLFLAISLIGVLWVNTAPSVSACSCGGLSDQTNQVLRNWNSYDRVFQGVVVDRKRPVPYSDPFVHSYKFRVSRVWKGDVKETMWLRQEGGSAGCSWGTPISGEWDGREWVMFAGPKGASSCGPSAFIEDTEKLVLAFLGRGQVPQSTSTSHATWTGLGLIGVYIAGFFTWAARRD